MNSNYVPKSRKSVEVIDAPTVQVSDLTLVSDDFPVTLAEALTAVEHLLQLRGAVYEAIRDTSSSIPSLLEKRLELESSLEARDEKSRLAVEQQLDQARRRRLNAISELLTGKSIGHSLLVAARQTLENAQREYATSVVQEFRSRYDAAVSALQQLWAEGKALSDALGTKVDMPLPVRISMHPARSGTIEPVTSPDAAAAVNLPVSVSRLSEVFDRVEASLQVSASVQAVEKREAETNLRERSGGLAAINTDGLFQTVRAFMWLGQEFTPGTIVDTSLVPPAMLKRLLSARCLRKVTSSAGAAVVGAAGKA